MVFTRTSPENSEEINEGECHRLMDSERVADVVAVIAVSSHP